MALFKKPDGQFVDVPDDQSQAALSNGYTPATEQQYEASKSPVRAAVEGAVRGVTLGFGEGLNTAFQEGELEAVGVSPEAAALEAPALVKGRKSENPKAALVGEFGGIIAPAALAPEATVSALAGGGMRGALVEGGLMGLGQLISESTLDQTPLDVEKTAIGIGLGALTAGGTKKAFDFLGNGVSAGMRKLGGKNLETFLRTKADDLEASALGVNEHKYRDAILKLGRDEGIIGPRAALDGATLKKATDVSEKFGARIGDSMQEMERVLPLSGNPRLASEMADYVDQRLGAEFGKSFAHRDALTTAGKFTDDIRGVDRSWPELWKEQSALWKAGEPTTAAREVREATRQAIRDYAFDVAQLPGSGLVPGEFLGLRKLGQESAAAQSLASAFERKLQSSTTGVEGLKSFRPAAVAGFVGLSTGNPAAAVGSAVLESQMRKRGGFLLGSVMRGVADSKVFQSVGKSLSKRVMQVMATSPTAFGAMRPAFEKALMLGEEAVLETYLRAAAAESDGNTMTTLGLYPESPDEVEGAGRRISALSALQQGGLDVDAQLDAGVEGFLGARSGRPTGYKVPGTKDLLERMQAVRDVLRDPAAAYQSLPPEILEGAPGMAARLTNQLVSAARFLDSKAPKNPYEMLPISVRPQWKPSEADVQKWYRYVEAVEAPAKVLERMSQGVFVKEHADALKAVYPETYADIQRRMFERLSVWEKPLSYEKKLTLTQLFGPQILGIQPQQVAIMQGTFHRDVDAPPSKGGNRPDGRQVVDAQKNQMTQAQRIENDV